MALISKLENIGNAIREKTGKTELLTLEQMPAEIAAIETGGKAEAPLVVTRSDVLFKPTSVNTYTTSGQVYYGPAENNYYKKYYWYRSANDNIYWEICTFKKSNFTTGHKYRFSTWIWHDNSANDNEEIEFWQNTIFFNSATSTACPLQKITKDPQLLQVEVDWTSSNDVYGATFYLYPSDSKNQVRLMPIIVEDLTSPSNNVPMPV